MTRCWTPKWIPKGVLHSPWSEMELIIEPGAGLSLQVITKWSQIWDRRTLREGNCLVTEFYFILGTFSLCNSLFLSKILNFGDWWRSRGSFCLNYKTSFLWDLTDAQKSWSRGKVSPVWLQSCLRLTYSPGPNPGFFTLSFLWICWLKLSNWLEVSMTELKSSCFQNTKINFFNGTAG